MTLVKATGASRPQNAPITARQAASVVQQRKHVEMLDQVHSLDPQDRPQRYIQRYRIATMLAEGHASQRATKAQLWEFNVHGFRNTDVKDETSYPELCMDNG